MLRFSINNTFYEPEPESEYYKARQQFLEEEKIENFKYPYPHPLVYAASRGRLDVVKTFLNLESARIPKNEKGTAFTSAANRGLLEIVKYIYENEHEQIETEDIAYAIKVAVLGRYIDVISYLLPIANIVRCNLGMAYIAAAEKGHIEELKLIAGSKRELYKDSISQALQLSSRWGWMNVVEYMLDKESKSFLPNDYGNALLEATHCNKQKIADLIIEKAKDQIPTHFIKSAYEFATREDIKHDGIANLLRNHFSDEIRTFQKINNGPRVK